MHYFHVNGHSIYNVESLLKYKPYKLSFFRSSKSHGEKQCPFGHRPDDIHQRQRADGPAAMLGIGTANPTNCVLQDQFADWFFRVTKSEHLAELKAKTKKICENLLLFN